MLSSLPNKLLTYIFEFLEIKDCASVLLVCKQFSATIEDHNKFWTRECFRRYISFDLDLYSEIYSDEEYKTCIKQRTFAISKNIWKKLITGGNENKNTFSALIRQVVSREEAEGFLENLDETLRQPPLPPLTLKRETMNSLPQTFFQSKLSEVLYDDTKSSRRFKFFDEYKNIIDELINKDSESLTQSQSVGKEELLKARWYLYEVKENNKEKVLVEQEEDDDDDLPPELPTMAKDGRISTSSSDGTSSTKKASNIVLDLYECLYNFIHHFCTVQAAYLDSIENVYDLLAEYTTRWNTYVCSMLEFERLFESFTKAINENYESLFEGYPCYPKFSIWRFMTKIWVKEIFEKANFKLILNESFLRVLSNHREKNIKQFLNTNIVNINFHDGNKYAELPKNLYVGLNAKRKKNSSIRYQSSEKLNNIHHACFGDVMDLEKRLLYNFIQSILDISLNEIKIHYLSSSDVTTNYPYHELEECFLMKSDEFYNDHQHLFNDSPAYFCHFLKSDFELLSEVLTERTNFKLQTVQAQNGLQFMKNFMVQNLKKTNLSHFESLPDQMIVFEEQNEGLNEFIETVTKDLLEEVTQEQQKPFNFFKLPSIDFEEEDEENCCQERRKIYDICSQHKHESAFVKKLISFFTSVNQEFKANFGYLHEKIEFFERVKFNDNIIKEGNISKNIPYEMGDVDCLFYDIDKNIRVELLNKLYQDYADFLKQQEEELANKGDNNNNENDTYNNQNGFVHDNTLEGDFGHDFRDLDLMTLSDTQLRRSNY